MSFRIDNLNRRTLLAIATVLIIIGVFIYNGILSNTRKTPSIPVQSEIAQHRDVPHIISLRGFVTPENTVDIRPQVTATVKSIEVKEGQLVKAGELLLTLDDREAGADADKLSAEVAKDQALLDDARRKLKRNQELRAKGFIAQSTVDSAQSAVDAAQASLNASRSGLASGRVTVDYYQLISPITGRIGEITAHLGSLVRPNAAQAIATITQMDPIEVAFNVPEKHAHALLTAERTGTVPVTAQLNNEKIIGYLSFVDNAIDSTTGNLKAKASFENKQNTLWPGALVDVQVTVQTFKNAVVISPRSVQVGPDGQFVYVIADDGIISAQPITIDYVTPSTAVVSGLKVGSHIVMEGGQNLRPGKQVTKVVLDDKKSASPKVDSKASE